MFDQTGNEKIFESKVKKSISWKLVKNCSDSVQRVLFSFLISRHWTALEVFEVLSLAMTSSLEMVRIKKFSLILRFSDLLNSEKRTNISRFTCLRFVRQVSPPYLPPRARKKMRRMLKSCTKTCNTRGFQVWSTTSSATWQHMHAVIGKVYLLRSTDFRFEILESFILGWFFMSYKYHSDE